MSDLANSKGSPETYTIPKVSMQTKLSYGYGSFGKDYSLALVNTFLFFYLTDVANVSAAAVGVIFLVARVWDTINDVLFGYMIAKMNTRWGKYKPWIFFGNIFNAIFMVACFCTHYFEGTTQLVYLTVVYIAWGMSYTICDAPFWSLIPLITLDKGEREGLLPYPRFAATIGAYIAAGCGLGAVKLFGNGDDGLGYALFAATGAFFAFTSAAVTCKWTEENYEPANTDSFSLKEAAFIVANNKQFLIFLIMAFCYIMGVSLMGALNLYIFKYVLGSEDLFSTQMLCASIVAVPCLIFFKPMVNWLGRRTIFMMAITFPFITATLVAFAHFELMPMNPLIIVSGFFLGFSNSIYWLLVMIMVADTVDYGDYHFKIRSECVYYSLHTLLSKGSGAICSAIVGLFLALVNYVPNVEQAPETITGLIWLFWGSAVLCVAGLLIYTFFYKLNGQQLDIVQQELTRRYMEKLVEKARSEGSVEADKAAMGTADNK